MAHISNIKIGSNVHEVKDAAARASIEELKTSALAEAEKLKTALKEIEEIKKSIAAEIVFPLEVTKGGVRYQLDIVDDADGIDFTINKT